MTRKVAIGAATLASLLALPFAGCGGSDSTTQSVTTDATSSTTPLSAEEFITAADARCAEANAAIANLSTDASPSSTVVQQRLGITQETLGGLKGLGSPEDPDGSLNDFYTAVKEQISVLKQQQTALAGGTRRPMRPSGFNSHRPRATRRPRRTPSA